jgi:hypothetical protein
MAQGAGAKIEEHVVLEQRKAKSEKHAANLAASVVVAF